MRFWVQAPPNSDSAADHWAAVIQTWDDHWDRLAGNAAAKSPWHRQRRRTDPDEADKTRSPHHVMPSLKALFEKADRQIAAGAVQRLTDRQRMGEAFTRALSAWAQRLEQERKASEDAGEQVSDLAAMKAGSDIRDLRDALRWLQDTTLPDPTTATVANRFESAAATYCTEWEAPHPPPHTAWRVCEMLRWPLVCGRTWEYGAADDPDQALHALADALERDGSHGEFAVQWQPGCAPLEDGGPADMSQAIGARGLTCLALAFRLPGAVADDIKGAAAALRRPKFMPSDLPGALLSPSARKHPDKLWTPPGRPPGEHPMQWGLGRAELVLWERDGGVRAVENGYRNFALEAPDAVMRGLAAQGRLCTLDPGNPLPISVAGERAYGLRYGPAPEHTLWLSTERGDAWGLLTTWRTLWLAQVKALGVDAWHPDDEWGEGALHPHLRDGLPRPGFPSYPTPPPAAEPPQKETATPAEADAEPNTDATPTPTELAPAVAASTERRPSQKSGKPSKDKRKKEQRKTGPGKATAENADETPAVSALEAAFVGAVQPNSSADEDASKLRRQARRLAALNLPEQTHEEVTSALMRLSSAGGHWEKPVDAGFLRLLEQLPWGRLAPLRSDLSAAAQALSERHYGLKDVKARILDLVAAQMRRPTNVKPICLIGPPGVGKTTIASAVAHALGRPFERLSLAGVSWDTELRGNSRLWSGARPGAVVKSLRRAGAMNPLLLLDEIDKVGSHQTRSAGPMADALLELLDPSQNHCFRDHYLDFEMDVSHILFFASANDVERLARPLQDRMELVEVPGYLHHEKKRILTRHIIPRQAQQMGFSPDEFTFTRKALKHLVTQRSPESGVRLLSGAVSRLAERRARHLLERPNDPPCPIRMSEVTRALGPAADAAHWRREAWRPGTALGLSVGPSGGDVMRIEAAFTSGKSGDVLTTGRMGDVMRESVLAARHSAAQWLRGQPEGKPAARRCLKSDLHVHAPAGAVPKDGPSAGVAMAAALASLALRTPARQDVAMTGEVTLTGAVLPVGGVRDKVAAANWSGLRTIVLPKGNRGDVERMPKRATKGLTLVFVETVNDVLDCVLPPADAPSKQAEPAPVPPRA